MKVQKNWIKVRYVTEEVDGIIRLACERNNTIVNMQEMETGVTLTDRPT